MINKFTHKTFNIIKKLGSSHKEIFFIFKKIGMINKFTHKWKGTTLFFRKFRENRRFLVPLLFVYIYVCVCVQTSIHIDLYNRITIRELDIIEVVVVSLLSKEVSVCTWRSLWAAMSIGILFSRKWGRCVRTSGIRAIFFSISILMSSLERWASIC